MSEKTVYVTGDKYFNGYTKYSPNDLIKIASDMKDDGILSIEFCAKEDYGSIYVYFECERLETSEESKLRLEEEDRRQKQRIKTDEENLNRLARQLNYKIEKLS